MCPFYYTKPFMFFWERKKKKQDELSKNKKR